jgi:multisubunit Na+/H+ antiporter MnhB subunit
MVSLILPVIATFLGPQLSEKIWRKDTVSIQKLLNFSNFLTSTSAVVIFIVLFSFASFFLGFFGPDFLF